MLRKDKKRLGIICLCAAILFSSIPVSVFAQEAEEQQETAEVLEDEPEENEEPERTEEEESEASGQETEDSAEEEQETEETEEEDPSEEPEEPEEERKEGTEEAGEPEDEQENPEDETEETEEIEEEAVSKDGEAERAIQKKQEALDGTTPMAAVPAPHAARIELEFIEVAAMDAEARAGSIGISSTAPKAGQQNRYEYTGGAQSFTAPADGYYDIYCYGSEGGSTYESWDKGKHKVGSVNCVNGGRGDMRGGRAWLKKGTVLSITTAAKGGSRTFHETPDYCKDHDVDWAGGIGNSGGATYIVCGGTTILSASGGSAGRMDIRDHPCNGNYTENGTGNRGSMAMNNVGGSVGWQTGQLNATDYGVNTGNGYVLISVHSVDLGVELSASETRWTKEDVVITAKTASTGAGLGDMPYCWERDEAGNEIWTGSSRYTVSQNGTYTCKIRDTAGNTSQAQITVTNMDRLAPEAELEADTEEWTNGDVTLTATAEDAAATGAYGKSGLVKACYSFEEDESGDPVWVEEAAYVVSQNGTYLCRVRDSAGNITEISYEVNNIDRLAPETGVALSTEDWTNQDIIIRVTGDDAQAGEGSGRSGIEEDGYAWGTMDTDGEIRWEVLDPEETGQDTNDGMSKKSADIDPVWTEKSTYTVTQNGTYLCRVRDRAGNEKETTIKVENIDKLAPAAEITASTREKTDGPVILYMRAEDAAASPEYGSSGIDEYCFILTGKEGGTWTKESSQAVSQNGTYVCKVRDAAGNITELRYTVSNINETGGNSGGGGSGGGNSSGGNRPSVPVPPAEIPPAAWYEQDSDSSDHGGDSVVPIAPAPVIPVRQPEDLLTVTGLPVLETEFRLPEDLPAWTGERKSSAPEEETERTVTDIPMNPGLSQKKILRYAAQGAAATSGGVIFYFVLFYVIRSAGILAMNMDQEYVYIGRRRLKKRHGMYQVRIDPYLYSKADTEHFQIKPGKGFVRKYEGKMMIVRYKDRKIQAVIGKEIKVRIPSERNR